MAMRLPKPIWYPSSSTTVTVDAAVWTNGNESGQLQVEFDAKLFAIPLNRMIARDPTNYYWLRRWNIGDPPLTLVFNLS
jgi:hypothetical protein